jgi:uncharacterized oxidoreductase
MTLTGNTILITGGASGIGLGLTERFLKEGNKVIMWQTQRHFEEASNKFPSVIKSLRFICGSREMHSIIGF